MEAKLSKKTVGGGSDSISLAAGTTVYEMEAIRRILLRICRKWEEGTQGQDLVTETVILSQKESHANLLIPPPGIPTVVQDLIETIVISGNQRDEKIAKKAAVRPSHEDVLAETVILGKDRK
jgi:hypothetical protein